MKVDQLLDALGDIAPRFVREAEEEAFPRRYSMIKHQRRLVYFVSAAACIGLVVFGTRLGVWEDIRGGGNYAETESAPAETESAPAAEAPAEEASGVAEEAAMPEASAEEAAASEEATTTEEYFEGETLTEKDAAAAGAADGEELGQSLSEERKEELHSVLLSPELVATIEITDGNTGEVTVIREDAMREELLMLYEALRFEEDMSGEGLSDKRAGYSRSMRLLDHQGTLLQTVTPYIDQVVIDGVTYSSKGNDTSRKLLEKLELF
ncbi:MAG: hypothetical protein IJC59_06285 [Lachnospiraceae bacterium]|nr:hypothetical protein [Lachnospiraceae bacterium]